MIDLPGLHELSTQCHLPLEYIERATAQLDLSILACFGPILLASANARLRYADLSFHEVAVIDGEGNLL